MVEAPLAEDAAPVVRSSSRQPLPSPEEREAALAVLREDPVLGPELAAERLVPYRAMPPLVGTERDDGTVERVITVGLRPEDGDASHEIVGVHLGRREVVRFEGGAPPNALAAAHSCGAPNANQATVMSRAGSARVTVKRDGELLWRFIVIQDILYQVEPHSMPHSNVNAHGVIVWDYYVLLVCFQKRDCYEPCDADKH